MSKRILAAMLLFCLLVQSAWAQDGFTTYLPFLTKGGRCELMTDAILRVTDGAKVIDLLGPGSGWQLADPYWQPQIAQFKGGGAFVDSGLAEGKQLVHKEYDNVVETLNLSVTGIDQGAAIQTIRDLLQLGRQSSDYWTESYEYDDVWLEVKPACANSLTGYSRIIKMSIPNLNNIFGQPFFSAYAQPVMEDIVLIIEREPFWRGTPPGEMIGPLYNLIKNPDFELWNFGTSDSQPDNWNDLESLWITGKNSRDDKQKWGNYDLKVRVSGSTKAGAVKGVTQVILGTESGQEYTVIAWVRSDGVSNGVGRVLVNYSSQLELYRSSDHHGWTLYTGKITTGSNDVVSINCEILTTAANTDGTVYFDGLLFIEGDWVEEAENGILPYMSSSHITNHTDQLESGSVTAGHINFVDMWNIAGDVDALVRLEMVNNTVPASYISPTENYHSVKIGLRRAGDVANFSNYAEPSGIDDTACSSDNKLDTGVLSTAWKRVYGRLITNNLMDNLGRFRLLCRIYDTKASGQSTLNARLVYFIGDSNTNLKTLDTEICPVVSQWAMMNLTETKGMIQDAKDRAKYVSQIGYYLELSRTGGTDKAYVDYCLTLPTDGGFIEADITPSIKYNNFLAVDNTHSFTVTASSVKGDTFIRELQISGVSARFVCFVIFNNDLYAGGSDGTKAVIYRRKNGIWSLVYQGVAGDLTTYEIVSMTEYNGKLYAAARYFAAGNQSFILRSSDGTSWAKLHAAPTPGGGFPNDYSQLIVYNGKLYAFSRQDLAIPGDIIETFDDSIWVTILTSDFVVSYQPTVLGNELYAGGLSGGGYKIDKYNPIDGWRNIFPVTANSMLDFSIIDGRIMTGYSLGTNYTVAIYGGSFEYINTGIPDSSDIIEQIVNYNGILYGLNHLEGMIISEDGGKTWERAFQNRLSLATTYTRGIIFEGLLFVLSDVNIYSYKDKTVEYIVPDFKGSEFSPPSREKDNEKRHRYIFSYDRENYINVADDAALIGIGIVPRYLSLINYNPQ